jgi:putative ABC transport system permease protein
MQWLDALRARVRLLLSPNAAEARMDEEFRFHIQMETERGVREGLSPAEARRQAMMAFGGVEQHKEGMRDDRGARWLDDLVSDLRYSLRSLRKVPGFALVAILTLALGIGANTAIFSIMQGVLFRPLPVAGLDRLVVVREDLPNLGLLNAELAPAEVLDLAAKRELFESVASFRSAEFTLAGEGDPSRISGALTLGDFFGLFGVRPHLGTFYGARNSVDGPHEVAVVSHGFWQRASGGDSAFVGRTIQLGDQTYEVVGVLPPDFQYPRQAEVWLPFAFTARWADNRGSLFMTTLARPRAGLSEPQVAAQLDAEVARWNEQFVTEPRFAKELTATPFLTYTSGSLRPVLIVLMGAVVFVLLIATANVANLQLVRATGRGREFAVRAAMGASRFRMVRQLVVESLVLAVAGGAAGLWIGIVALRLLERWEPAQQMGLTGMRLDGTALAFTALVALLTAVAFGTVPALRASRVNAGSALREGARGSSHGLGRHRLLKASIVAQVALAIVLLVGSGLMIRTLSRLMETDLGFEVQNVTTVKLEVPRSSYPEMDQRRGFFTALLERARGLPGVQSVALMWGLPFTGETDSSPFGIPGRPEVEGGPERHAEARFVSPELFATLGVPLLSGRDFTPQDRGDAPRVVIIDRTFAEQFFPGEDAVGKQVVHYVGGDPSTIIGVVDRVDHDEIADAPKATAYYSLLQHPWMSTPSVVVRSTTDAGGVATMVRGAIRELDPKLVAYDIQTMEARVHRSLAPRRLAMLALGTFSALSLLLTTLGVYGVMRYTTQQRNQEIGILVALGAQPRDIIGLVVRQGVAMSLLGALIGIAAALGLTRLMSGILFGVSPQDPATFAGVAALLVGVTLVASWLPARRASRMDPALALRAE